VHPRRAADLRSEMADLRQISARAAAVISKARRALGRVGVRVGVRVGARLGVRLGVRLWG